VAAAALTTGGLVLFRSGDSVSRFCTADGLVAPGGPYGRDPNQDCLFVGSDGKPYTTSDGQLVN
jgi:hypothetical protein